MTSAEAGVVVDTSAIVAILTGEPGAAWLSQVLAGAAVRLMAAPTVVELGIVLEARLVPSPESEGIARRAVRDAGITVRLFDDGHAERAVRAWRRFGKGRHPAALNLGDTYAYALAEATGLPILCTGDDFAQTDLAVLVPPG